MTIRAWSTTASSNNSAPPAGAPEGQTPGSVNNVIRQVMAEVRDTFEQLPYLDLGHTATRVDADTFTVPTDLTATYTAGRSIKLVGASTQYGTVSSSSYSAPDTTVNVVGTVPTSLSTVSVGVAGAQTRYDITAAEIAATTTPINYAKWPSPWKDASRFVSDNTGVTDVTDSFIEAVKAEKVLIVPEGTYLLNKVAVASQLILKRSNFELLGTGNNTVFTHTASGVITGQQGVINLFPIDGDISGIHLANFRIVGPVTNTGAAPNSTVRMLGLLVHDGTSSHYVTDVLIENVTVEGMEMACFGFNGLSATAVPKRIKLVNCVAKGGRQDGFNDYGAADGLELINCNAFDLDGFGHEHASSALIIRGGEVARCGQSGIGLEYNATLGANKKKIIQGVYIHDITTAAIPDASGISLGQSANPFNTEIFDNRIYRTGGHGIIVNLSPSHIDIDGNSIEDVGGGGVNKRGIQIPNATTYVSIRNNKIKLAGAGYTMDYGIVSAGAGSATNLIANNDIVGAGTQKIFAFYPSRILRGIPTYVSTSAVGNVGAGEDNLISYSLPALSLEGDNQAIKITVVGTTAANGNNKQVKLYFGSVQLVASGALAANNKDWRFECILIRTGSTTFTASTSGEFNATLIPADTVSGGSQDFTIANTIKCTGEATSDNDIVQSLICVEFLDGY